MSYCEWQGQVVSIDEGNRLLSLSSLQKNGAEGWVLAKLKSISFPHRLNCHSLNVILDTNHGLYSPFILANHTGTSKYEVFECNFSSTQLVSRFKYDCLPQHSSSTLVMNGPRLLRCQGSALIITTTTSSGTCSSVTYDIQSLFCKKGVIDRFWAFEWSSTGVDDTLLIMARLTAPAKTTQPPRSLDWACFVVSVRKESGPVPVLEYVPHEYGCIATCITCSNFVTVSACSGGFVSQPRFYVGTSSNQVVVFEQGVLIHCVPLEMTPHQIVVMGILTDVQNPTSIAVRSMAGKCYVYKLCAEGQNQGGKVWHDTSGIAVGDFANIGHSQLLMMHSNGNGEQDNVIVTDLHGFSTEEFQNDVDMAEAGVTNSEGNVSSLSETVKAFKHRKHMGDIQLAEMESEVQRKSDLIRSSLSFMNSLEHSTSDSASNIPSHRSDLICIVPGKMDIKDNQRSLTCPQTRGSSVPTSLLKVVQVWQRWEGGQWVIGFILKNASETEISSLCLSLLVSGGANSTTHESLSRVVWTNALKFPTSTISVLTSKPPAKRLKVLQSVLCETETNREKIEKIESGHMLCVVASTSLPNWSQQNKMEATAVISFRIKSITNPSVESELEMDYEVAVVSIPVSVHLDQICSEQLNIDQSCLRLWTGDSLMLVDGPNWERKEHQDLATLLGSQSIVQISVTTELIQWGQLCSILKRRLPLCKSYSLQHPTGMWSQGISTSEVITALSSPNKSLDGVGLCVTPSLKKRNRTIVSVLYRLESQLSLVLAVLKRSLPEGAVLGLN